MFMFSVENETESGATDDTDRVNNTQDDEMEEDKDEAVIEEPASQEKQVEPDTRSQAQSQEGLESQEEPSSEITIGEVWISSNNSDLTLYQSEDLWPEQNHIFLQVQTIPVPVVKANQGVVDGEEAREVSIKGKVISESQPDICDTDNNVLI